MFNLYIDGHLTQLSVLGVGDRMADLYLGCLTYADDITLVSSSIARLQTMLDMCTVYAKEHHLIFNSKKSVMITFKKKRYIYKQSHDPEVFLNDARLPNKDEIVHLGVVMNAHCAIESSLEARRRKFYAAVNGVVTQLGGICSNDSVAKISTVRFCFE